MELKQVIHLDGDTLQIVKKCHAALYNTVHTKFSCVLTFEGIHLEDETSHQRGRPTVPTEKRLEFHLSSGVKVSVWKADLTSFKCDAVVNAANKHLQHYGGLALSLSQAGGPQIQNESSDYVKKYGKVKTGDAVTLGPGCLPCKKIIHAVGPELPQHPSMNHIKQNKPLLIKAINSILDEVQKHHLVGVAIPAISSGLFHYPLDDCARTIVSAVKNYFESSPSHIFPKEVFLVNHDEPTVSEMERACKEILASSKQKTYSQAAAANKKTSPRTSEPSVQLNNVVLTLKKDKIEDQKTDVIVNTASKDFNLNIGEISKAILRKAGSEMQREVNAAASTGFIICTDGYRLHCKQVFHTSCTEKSEDPQSSQIFHDSVFDCLRTASAKNFKSISFPAIGTGNLGFTKRESAWIMTEAVLDFVLNHPSGGKLEVNFVIFPSDHDTFTAFHEQIRSLQRKLEEDPHFLLSVPERKENFQTSKHLSPQISLRAPNEESMREAQAWLENILLKRTRSFKICNNFIQHLGESDYVELSRLKSRGVFFEEGLEKGQPFMKIDAESKCDAAVAALQVESRLCKVCLEFVSEEEREIKIYSGEEEALIDIQKVSEKNVKFIYRADTFKKHGLRVVKVSNVLNRGLAMLFDLKKNQMQNFKPKKMFQLVPVQFCEMITRVGFHKEFAPPTDPAYGDGIYFADNIKAALELWKDRDEEFMYFVEAEVLRGKSTAGKRDFILPPVMKGSDVTYDSLDGGTNVSVVFSSYQALPTCIITCLRSKSLV